jgi:LTXXQ motif family protein
VNDRMRRAALYALAMCVTASHAVAQQDAGAAREAARARREARREAAGLPPVDREQIRLDRAMAERLRAEGALREALGQVVRQRLNLNDQQATRLMDVNRRFGEDRLRIVREEMRIRRELRGVMSGGDTARSPNTARLLDQMMEAQRQRLDVQQKEQQALSEFLTPEQRARYLAMMDQLRRRIQLRADSARAAGVPPGE